MIKNLDSVSEESRDKLLRLQQLFSVLADDIKKSDNKSNKNNEEAKHD